MPEMVAKVAQEYPVGTKRSPGERFHVNPEHVKLLTVIGRVEPLDGAPPPTAKSLQAAAPAAYRTREMAAAPVAKGPKKTRHRESLLAKGR